MSFRSSLCRILLRPGSLRTHSIGETSLASDVAKAASYTRGAFSGGKHEYWIDSQSHIYSIYGNRAAITNGLLSLQQTHESRHCSSYASGSLQELQSPPEPFQLIDKPNAYEVFLQRSFGVEDIEISCVYHDQTYGDNDGEEGFDPPPPNVPMKMVQMTIKISVGCDRPFLEIVCLNFGDRSSIEQVLLKDQAANIEDVPYEGPEISMLSDKIKSGFVQYLEARGIDNELGKFLLGFIPQRAQQKCVQWLSKVERFVEA